MTTHPTVEDLGYLGRLHLSLVLFQAMGDTPDVAARVRKDLSRLRQHPALPEQVHRIVDAAFSVAAWAALHPEQHAVVREAARSLALADDRAPVFAAVPAEGQPALGGLAAAVADLDQDEAGVAHRQLLFLADHLSAARRVTALLRQLAALTAACPRPHPTAQEA